MSKSSNPLHELQEKLMRIAAEIPTRSELSPEEQHASALEAALKAADAFIEFDHSFDAIVSKWFD